MALCDLISGILVDCSDKSIGGIDTIWAINADRVLTVTETATFTISAITLSAGTSFQEFKPNRDSSSYNQTSQVDVAKGLVLYEPTVALSFSRGDQDKRNALRLLARTEVIVIVKDNNGIYWLFGKNLGLNLSASTMGSGTVRSDFNGLTVELKGGEVDPIQEIESTCIVALNL